VDTVLAAVLNLVRHMTITILSIAHIGISNILKFYSLLGYSHRTCVLIYKIYCRTNNE
jgi:hypothetical protein